MEDKY